MVAPTADRYVLPPRRLTPRSVKYLLAFVIMFIIMLSPLFAICRTYQAHSGSSAAAASALVAFDTLEYFAKFPLGPYQYGEMGQRVQLINHRLELLENKRKAMTAKQSQALAERLDDALVASFPFIRNPSAPSATMSFQALRSTYKKGSRGIVLSLGQKDFRYACHLITGIRNILGSTLPIQVAYAGNDDLPREYREKLTSLGKDIETLDLLSSINDMTLDLAHGTFATKPIAMLASQFEQVMLVDADAVFLQPPEALFESRGYKDTGTYFFHDRLLYQNGFPERLDWWRSHLKYNPPSPSLLKLKSYTQNYSAEQDSGVVVFDKGRTPVLLGLLHTCWQNSADSREYMKTMIHGDKESFWFGLELSRVPYYFAKHYGNSLGPVSRSGDICGNAIAHTDEDDKLLWFNGALLKNKWQDQENFGNFSHYMLDGEFRAQNGGDGVSCEHQGEVLSVDEKERKILSDLVEQAKYVDSRFKDLTTPKSVITLSSSSRRRPSSGRPKSSTTNDQRLLKQDPRKRARQGKPAGPSHGPYRAGI